MPAAMTLAEFFEHRYLPYAKVHKRSWPRDEELFRLRTKERFGSRRLTDIARHEVQTFHAQLLAGGLSPASADHHVKLLRRMLNLAVEWELLEKNPLKGFRLFNAYNRVEHLLSDAEVERLVQVLRTDANRAVCRIALFLLSVGAD